MYSTAKKSAQKLSEDDQDVIDLERIELSMEAAVDALKYEYTNSIITRITPGVKAVCYVCMYAHTHTHTQMHPLWSIY